MRRNLVQKLFHLIYVFFRAIYFFFKTLVVPLFWVSSVESGSGNARTHMECTLHASHLFFSLEMH